MAEQEKEYQPILPPSPEDEKPEEGFVPYCGSEEADPDMPRSNKKFVLLIVLIIAVVLLAFIMMFGIGILLSSNSYKRIIKNNRNKL